MTQPQPVGKTRPARRQPSDRVEWSPLTNLDASDYLRTKEVPTLAEPRKFLGIHYQCCNVYARAYIDKEGKKYVGSCPRCRKRVEVKVGKGGTNARFFNAT